MMIRKITGIYLVSAEGKLDREESLPGPVSLALLNLAKIMNGFHFLTNSTELEDEGTHQAPEYKSPFETLAGSELSRNYWEKKLVDKGWTRLMRVFKRVLRASWISMCC